MRNEACVDCNQSLLCSVLKYIVPLVCPSCKVEWMYVAPNGLGESGVYALHHNVKIPVGECPRGPLEKCCPACELLANRMIQFNFDGEAGEKDVEKYKEELKRFKKGIKSKKRSYECS